jgi:hypothetical protein
MRNPSGASALLARAWGISSERAFDSAREQLIKACRRSGAGASSRRSRPTRCSTGRCSRSGDMSAVGCVDTISLQTSWIRTAGEFTHATGVESARTPCPRSRAHRLPAFRRRMPSSCRSTRSRTLSPLAAARPTRSCRRSGRASSTALMSQTVAAHSSICPSRSTPLSRRCQVCSRGGRRTRTSSARRR